jgi:SAM-dependent methyltransferase
MNVSEQTSATERLREFQAQTHRPAHARRTAEKHAAFFLPHLTPSMRLLDAGCGPGSITIGLANAIGPGEAVGVDVDIDVMEPARALARERGCANVTFARHSVYDLPYDDGEFDAAFMFAVLQHLEDPHAALVELRRVLRPGGVIGVTDADWDGVLLYPPEPLIDRGTEILGELRARGGGGDPRVGKRLRALLHDAGFVRIAASAAAGAEGDAAVVRFNSEWQARYFEAPAVIDRCLELGLASRADMAAIAAAWRAWGASPGAFRATFFCQAVGWRE